MAQQKKPELQIIDQTQYLASYNYEFQRDSSSNDSRRITTMLLYIGKNQSKFENSNYYIMDSMWINQKGKPNTQNILKQLMGNPTPMLAQYSIVKQTNSPKIDLYERVLSKNYRIKEEIQFNWNILSTRDTLIAGYKCREARTSFRGRTYRAWYTPAIPINDGPYKFKDLPGLIVKLEDIKKEHCFELSSFNRIKYDKPIYFLIGEYITIKPSDYAKIKHTESLARMRRVSSNQVVTQENTGNIEANIKRRNNIIEKY